MTRESSAETAEKGLPSHTFVNEIGAGNDQAELVASGVLLYRSLRNTLWSELTRQAVDLDHNRCVKEHPCARQQPLLVLYFACATSGILE